MDLRNTSVVCSSCQREMSWMSMVNDAECQACVSERNRKKLQADEEAWMRAKQQRLAADRELYGEAWYKAKMEGRA